jgi:hypothetical protein
MRTLIERDLECTDAQAFDGLRGELQEAFAKPDDSYEALDADTVIKRNLPST